jgi:reactive intermediate/imine deaminase
MSTPARNAVSTEDAPAAIGPYSQAVQAGDLVITSGQIALDPATGAFEDGDAAAQARRVMSNLGAVLEAAGSSFAGVVRCTVYLTSMEDFAAVNEVYAESFPGEDPPARACVEVAALPKGARVEIDCIALR